MVFDPSKRSFGLLEARSGYPRLDYLDLGVAGGIAVSGAVDLVCKGAVLLNGSAFASVSIGTLDFDAVVPGEGANDYSVEVVDSGSGGLTIDMSTDPNKLVIDQGASTSDEDTVATAINDAAADTYGKIRANSAGGGVVAVTAEVPLTGGVGADFSATIAGIDVPPLHPVGAATAAASVSDATITLHLPVLTSGGAAAGDVGILRVVSNGIMEQISSVLV